MEVSMKSIFHTFLLSLLLVSVSGQTMAKDSLGSSIKEIFVKGSVANENLFLVLGFEDANNFAKKTFKNIIDKEDLVDIAQDSADAVSDTADFYWNGEASEYTELVGEAASYSKRHMKKILSSPWKSLKKIPQSYKVGMERANDSFRNSSNAVVGSTLWAANAVWVNIKGAYYLVVEAPARAVGEILATTVAVPGAVVGAPVLNAAFLTLRLGFEAVQLSYQLTKSILAASLAVTSYAYATVTTSIAAGVVTVGAVALQTAKLTGAIISYPFTYKQRAKTKLQTDVNYKELDLLTDFIAKNLGTQGLQDLKVNTSVAINNLENHPVDRRHYKAQLDFFAQDGETEALSVEVSIKFNKDKSKQNIVLTSYANKKHFNNIKKERNLKSKEMKKVFKAEISKALENVVAQYVASKESLDEAI